MARPYQNEMAELAGTAHWIAEAETASLVQSISRGRYDSILAVGSGGSLSAAHALAQLHRRWTGHPSIVTTPLQAMEEPLDVQTNVWLISAGGQNVDTLAVARTLIAREARQFSVLTTQAKSALMDLCEKHTFIDPQVHTPPGGKDGFLATNSLLGFSGLLARAYCEIFDTGSEWSNAKSYISQLVDELSETVCSWRAQTEPLWARNTTLLLYGPSARLGAVDLESKFTEAAIGNLQLADYRNFAHGRHHWLAKRGNDSAVIAFISDHDRLLAERTLALLPNNVPIARINLCGSPTTVMISSLIAAFRITGWAGEVRGIDPGRPGVPEFGRKLYSLRFTNRTQAVTMSGLTAADAAAIARKSGFTVDRLGDCKALDAWIEALNTYRNQLARAVFRAVVLDYDGTIVETRDRRDPPKQEMAEVLADLAQSAFIGIATGRGRSVRCDLQACLPKVIWPRIYVGYYNGGVIARLDENDKPKSSTKPGLALAELARSLRNDLWLGSVAKQEDRCGQLTLGSTGEVSPEAIWLRASQIIATNADGKVRLLRSGHSIDVVPISVCKLRLVEHLSELSNTEAVLTLGDRGRWPGNDQQLLSTPYSLSVDDVSGDPSTCWNLAPLGYRGPSATLFYLRALESTEGGLRLIDGAFN